MGVRDSGSNYRFVAPKFKSLKWKDEAKMHDLSLGEKTACSPQQRAGHEWSEMPMS